MTQLLSEHLEECIQKENRISDISASISSDKKQLVQLKEDYKQAVVSDGPDIDVLFHEMEVLEKKIKADSHKHETLTAVTNEHLKKNALHVLAGYGQNVKLRYENKSEQLQQRVEAAKDKYIQEIEQLGQEGKALNDDFKNESNDYWRLIRKHQLDKEEVNDLANAMYMRLEHAKSGFTRPYAANIQIGHERIIKGLDR